MFSDASEERFASIFRAEDFPEEYISALNMEAVCSLKGVFLT
jgi:hypothetical protein